MSVRTLVADILPATEAVQEVSELTLQPLPRAVAEARRFVREHAPPLPAETHDALMLLTSELVTNAVLHARTTIEVSVVVADESVVVTVHDLDLALPDQHPYRQREGGWGLGIVRALSQSAAMTPHPDGGKTAWFRLLRRPVPSAPDDAAARLDDWRDV